jgi:hypothetical protein
MGYMAGASLSNTYTATQLSGSESYAAPGIGDLLTTADGKRYRFVRYLGGAGSVAAVAGNAVGFYAPSGVSTGVTNDVTSDVSDTAGNLAGVLVAAPASGEYCWIQVGGVATIATTLVSGADGNMLTLSTTTDGTLKVSAAVTNSNGAVCIDASANIVMLQCPH